MSETAPQLAVATSTDALVAAVAEATAEIRRTGQWAREARELARQAIDGGQPDVLASALSAITLALWGSEARQADIAGIIRDGARQVLIGDVLGKAAPPALAAVPEQRRTGSHRKPRRWAPRPRTPGDGQIPLWSVKGMVAFVAAAKPAAVVAAAAGILVTGVGAGVVARAVLSHPAAPPAPPVTASASAPGWGVLVPNPSSSLIALTRVKPKQDAAKAGLADPDPVSSPSYTAASSPSSAPSASPSSQAPPAAGTLTVSTQALDLGVTGAASITVTASGGRVAYTALSASRDLKLTGTDGLLEDGQAATVSITASPAALLLGGSSTVTVSWGGGRVVIDVTWPAVPLLPSPLASVVPTVLPT